MVYHVVVATCRDGANLDTTTGRPISETVGDTMGKAFFMLLACAPHTTRPFMSFEQKPCLLE